MNMSNKQNIRCIARGCLNQTKGSKVVFFKLPLNTKQSQNLKKLWLEKLNLHHLVNHPDEYFKKFAVCSYHFGEGGKTHSKNHVPTVYADLWEVSYNPHPNDGCYIRQKVLHEFDFPTSPIGERPNLNYLKFQAIFRPPPSLISFYPKENLIIYVCFSCEDMFKWKECYLDHVNRRGMMIRYNCPLCKKLITFFNPCAFLLHYRRHYINQISNEEQLQINFNEINISRVPLRLVGLFQDAAMSLPYNTRDDLIGDRKIINTEVLKPLPFKQMQSSINLQFFTLVFKEHDKNKRLVLKQISSKLPLCKFVDFSHYVKFKQVKDMKRYELCNECSMEVINLKRHLYYNNRPNKKYKCLKCTFIAPTRCVASAHERMHYNQPPFVCPDCGHMFKNLCVLLLHIEKLCFHLSKEQRYACFECNRIYRTKRKLKLHFVKHARQFYACRVCRKTFIDDRTMRKHSLMHNNRLTCMRVFKCNLCGYKTNNIKAHLQHHVNWIVERPVYVYVCCKKTFCTKVAYNRHMLMRHSNVIRNLSQKTLFCLRCGKNFQYHSALIAHQRQCRNGIATNTKNHLIKTRGARKYYTCCIKCGFYIHRNDFFSHDCMPPGRKRYERYDRKIVQLLNSVEVVIHDKPDKRYKCHFCDYTEDDRTTFQEHIRTHRIDSNPQCYQCMDCGECFIVKLSLIKHLNYMHQIDSSDIDAYFFENECFDSQLINSSNKEQSVEEEPLEPNQCRVCRKMFTNKVDLNKHFRMHGMAFLKENSR